MQLRMSGYGYILNQAFHHERVSCASKTNGTFLAENPKLGMFVTGTPGMFSQLVPSTESGLYSRLLIYRIAGGGAYRGLTSSDNDPANASYFDELGGRMQAIAEFLDKSPTFVSFTDRQRKKLDRYFEREYYNVRVFGNDDITSVVLRHRLIIFRIAIRRCISKCLLPSATCLLSCRRSLRQPISFRRPASAASAVQAFSAC